MKPTALAATVALTLPLLATTSVTALAVTTEEFINKATISDIFEVQSGKLASDKAKNEGVKEFGEQMVEDHSETTDELMELINDENIDVQPPTKLDEKHQANLDKLKDVSGAKFDQTYIPMQVLAHEEAVNLFQDYSKSGDNDALKEWTADTLPTLKDHLKQARQLNEKLSKPAETAAADTDDDSMADDKKARDKTAEKKDERQAQDRTAVPFEYVTQQAPTDWTAQNLIGKTVENKNGEALGEINNVIVNEKGNVVAITVGVGGFLGLGEKDVGVPFEALMFRAEDAVDQDAEDTADMDAEHDNQVVVIDATKEQLEAAPDFVWLGEKRDKRADAETGNEATVE